MASMQTSPSPSIFAICRRERTSSRPPTNRTELRITIRRSVLIGSGSIGPPAHGAVSALPTVTIGAIQTQAIRRRLFRQAQHHVGDDAGDRDVEPKWKGPAGKLAVLRKAAGERKEEGDQDQRQRDYGQNDVAGEERKIKRAIGGKGWITDVSVKRVVKDVAHEK